jgi:hypothetical protein
VGRESITAGATPAQTAVQLLVTPPFKRARAVTLARALANIIPLHDTDVLELTLFHNYFDSLIEHAKEFFESVLDDLQRCNVQVLRQQIHDEEEKINWSEIYAYERRGIEGREPHDYAEFIRTVAAWEERTQGLPKPGQKTPRLFMAYHHAMLVRHKFESLLQGINSKLRNAKISVAPPKFPYRALEKMALEESEHRWTAHCVMDLARGAINCANTGDMAKALLFLDACTSAVRRGERGNNYVVPFMDLPEIEVVRMKNRFERPAKSGWADIFINFVFADDPNRHVHELQIQHQNLTHIRKEWGEDSHYAGLRVLAELLKTMKLTEEKETMKPTAEEETMKPTAEEETMKLTEQEETMKPTEEEETMKLTEDEETKGQQKAQCTFV